MLQNAPESCAELGRNGVTRNQIIDIDPDGKNQNKPPLKVLQIRISSHFCILKFKP